MTGTDIYQHSEDKMSGEAPEIVRFVADKMLGRLARWLRIIGQDVTYGIHLSGYELVRAARREGRLILTRDRGIRKKSPPALLLIQSDHFREQLKQVVHVCGLDPFKDLFTRCVECNTPFDSVPKGSVEKKVPPYVFSTQEQFSFCRSCQRIYWPATHQQKMMDELKSMGFNTPGI
ncbi:MAG: Mut7-C RNAse domain-containing protein [Deltaproteobacteria bacterium]|nr:Mut7-C RNAse domain-containing protein [Deltaproteobacteria bacterium]